MSEIVNCAYFVIFVNYEVIQFSEDSLNALFGSAKLNAE